LFALTNVDYWRTFLLWWGKALRSVTDPKTIEVANLEDSAPADSQYDHSGLVLEEVEAPAKAPEPTPPPVPEPTPEPVAKAPEAPTLPKAKHPSFLIKQAIKFGAKAEEIEAVDTDTLDRWVDEQAEIRAQAPAPKAEAPPEPKDEIDWGEDELGNKLTEKDHNSLSRKLIKEHHESKKAFKAAEQKIADLEKRYEQREAASVHDACDMAFSARADLEALYGKGARGALTPNDFKRRDGMYVLAGIAKGDSPAVARQKLEAVLALYHPKAATPPPPTPLPEAPRNGAERVSKEKWAEAGHLAPTTRKTQERKTRETAIANMEMHLKENPKLVGAFSDDDEALSPELNTVPD
jgi:hypothetical protein